MAAINRSRVQLIIGMLLAITPAALIIWSDIEVGPLAAVGVAGIALIATSRPRRRPFS